jgi:hypothetical protein
MEPSRPKATFCSIPFQEIDQLVFQLSHWRREVGVRVSEVIVTSTGGYDRAVHSRLMNILAITIFLFHSHDGILQEQVISSKFLKGQHLFPRVAQDDADKPAN